MILHLARSTWTKTIAWPTTTTIPGVVLYSSMCYVPIVLYTTICMYRHGCYWVSCPGSRQRERERERRTILLLRFARKGGRTKKGEDWNKTLQELVYTYLLVRTLYACIRVEQNWTVTVYEKRRGRRRKGGKGRGRIGSSNSCVEPKTNWS